MKEKPDRWVVRGIYKIAAKVNEIIESSEQRVAYSTTSGSRGYRKAYPASPKNDSRKRCKNYSRLASEETSQETVRMISRVASVRLKNNMFGGGVIGDSVLLRYCWLRVEMIMVLSNL